MIRSYIKILLLATIAVAIVSSMGYAQNFVRDYEGGEDEYEYVDRVRIDRYLDTEIWTNQPDGEYYEGDDIVMKFRTNRDAFVAIYSVDSRGRVNMLFPSSSDQDNYIQGGVTFSIPDARDEFDLVVTGPEGVENIQVVASRERFPIPDWYPNSGLICDWEDRADYMDYVNNRYFVRYEGQRFAYDRTVIYINEWEDDYFRPVYYPHYPSWTVYGNAYIDYPIGGTVYVNGIYWGCAPLYIPRLYVGWHTISVYDPYGYAWESDIHVLRYSTVVLDRTVIRPSRGFSSKYKEVRSAGYRDPVVYGYPDYKTKVTQITSVSKAKAGVSGSVTTGKKTKQQDVVFKPTRKYMRGDAKLVKTERGYESTAAPMKPSSGSKRKSQDFSTQKKSLSGSKSTGTVERKKVSGGTSGSYGTGRTSPRKDKTSTTSRIRKQSPSKTKAKEQIKSQSGNTSGKKSQPTTNLRKIDKRSKSVEKKKATPAPKIEKKAPAKEKSSQKVKSTETKKTTEPAKTKSSPNKRKR